MRSTVRLVTLSCLGTIIEWVDYIIFGYLIYNITKVFYPADNSFALVASFATLATGFLMRPLGGLVFGWIGDTLGRRRALIYSMGLMAFSTLGIGCLPGYSTLGIAAPFCLVFLRMLQGLAVGGEYNGAAVFVIEQLPHRPYFAGSLIGTSAACGIVLGGLLTTIVTLPGMPDYAWRLPFFFSAMGAIVTYFFRKGAMKPTAMPSFRVPTSVLFKDYKRSMTLVFFIAAFIGIFVYVGNVFMVSYLVKQQGLQGWEATAWAMFGEFISVLGIPLVGYYADKINAKKYFALGLLTTGLLAPFIYYFASFNTPLTLFISQILFGFCNAITGGFVMGIVYQAFEASIVYRGIGLSWGLGVALLGGTAPMVLAMLGAPHGSPILPGLYISLAAFIALGCFLKLSNATLKHLPFVRH